MRIHASVFLILVGLALYATAEEGVEVENDIGILECLFENNAGNCLRTRLARDLDEIESEVTGKKSEMPMSAVIEQAGNVIAEVVGELQESGTEGIIEENDAQNDGVEEARQKSGGKKRRRYMQRLMGMAMMMKAKLSLLLQLISTHFQMKFYAIAIVSLILNVARFWIELKKQPSKVVYYEHAQHQHHYDHDDHEHGGYWARSSNETPQDQPYRAYAPKE